MFAQSRRFESDTPLPTSVQATLVAPRTPSRTQSTPNERETPRTANRIAASSTPSTLGRSASAAPSSCLPLSGEVSAEMRALFVQRSELGKENAALKAQVDESHVHAFVSCFFFWAHLNLVFSNCFEVMTKSYKLRSLPSLIRAPRTRSSSRSLRSSRRKRPSCSARTLN